MTATTARTEAMIRDLETIQRETSWLLNHLGELDVIAHSKQFDERERAETSHQVATESPNLADLWQPALRNNIQTVMRILKRTAVEITACRVGLEQTYGGRGADLDKIGTELEPGELQKLREAKSRRDTNQGDPRWGDYEFRPDQQPAQRFK